MLVNKKTVYVLTLVATLGIVIMRIVQNLIMVEAQTGFFVQDYSSIGTAMLIFMAVVIITVSIFARFCKDKPTRAPEPNLLIGVAYAVLAVAVFYELFFTEISKNIPFWQVAVHLVLGVASTVTFLVFAVAGIRNVSRPGMLGIIPVIFWGMKLIIIFSNYSSLSTIAENVFELAALCGILVYVLSLAKLQNGVQPERTNSEFLSISVMSFMLCAVYSIPQMFLYLTGNRRLAHTTNVTFITSGAVMIFIVVYIIFAYRKENIKA